MVGLGWLHTSGSPQSPSPPCRGVTVTESNSQNYPIGTESTLGRKVAPVELSDYVY